MGPLRAALARPRTAKARGTVLLLEGRGEFLEKYARTVERLVLEGLAVLALDWRGQGGSPRLVPGTRRGHVGDFADYLEDLDLLLARARALGLPEPWTALAHSMGGHVALRHLAGGGSPIRRAALVTPMFDIALAPMSRPLVRLLARGARGLGGGRRYALGQRDPPTRCRFEGNPTTSCPEGFAEWWEVLRRHPERRVGGVTWGWLEAALRSIEASRAPGLLESVATPLLVLRAGDERIVCNRAIRRFVERLPAATLVDFPGARHDLLWERPEVRARVLDALVGFLLVGPDASLVAAPASARSAPSPT